MSARDIGHTIRNDNGRRVTYRPDWDSNRPWIAYWNGTAQPFHFPTEYGARQWVQGGRSPLRLER